MTEEIKKPWAYLAHKDGFIGGIFSAELPKKDISKYLGSYATDGFSIMTVFSSAEYLDAIKSLRPWSERSTASALGVGGRR